MREIAVGVSVMAKGEAAVRILRRISFAFVALTLVAAYGMAFLSAVSALPAR